MYLMLVCLLICFDFVLAYRISSESIENKNQAEFGKSKLATCLRRLRRGAVAESGSQSTFKKWENHTVPYIIWTEKGKGAFDVDGSSYKLIEQSMNDIEAVSCIRFKKYPFEERLPVGKYLVIYSGDSCKTVIGWQDFPTMMILKEPQDDEDDDHCMKRSIVTHELLHALGFVHEHQRIDRNKYVKVFAKNIKKDALQNFALLVNEGVQRAVTLGSKYDRLSITHYSWNSFAKKGKNSMVWKADESLPMGGDRMSQDDVLMLNTYYQCEGYPKLFPTPATRSDTSVTRQSQKIEVLIDGCPRNACKKEGENLHGLIKHYRVNEYFVDCYMGVNFGCYKCPIGHVFEDSKCAWKPNLSQ